VSLGEFRGPRLCFGGTNAGARCAVNTECPGGTCRRTLITGGGVKIEGETIFYRATLAFSTGAGACGYEGGSLCITPPGTSVCTDVTPSNKTCQAGANAGAACTTDAAVRIRVSAIRGPGRVRRTADGLPCTTDADCKNQCAADSADLSGCVRV